MVEIQLIKEIEEFKSLVIDLSLRAILYVHSLSYRAAGVLASMKEGGIHPKHRLIQYHRFFLDNIEPTDRVLDIGCGDGVLTSEMASKAFEVTGMDINASRIKKAKARNIRANLKYFGGDATELKLLSLVLPEKYDVITMSNVLEHIEKRNEFLSFWGHRGKKILIRVPALDRGWLPIYMKELGMDYRLDKDHKLEHTVATLKEELEGAGLELESYSMRFGEILAIAKGSEHTWEKQ